MQKFIQFVIIIQNIGRGLYHEKLLIPIFILLMISACGTGNADRPLNIEKYDQVLGEAYLIQAFDHEIGHYKKVNSLTLMNVKQSGIEVEAFLIEDFYDENEQYIKTKLLYSETKKGDIEVWVEEPMTIYLEDEGFNMDLTKELTGNEQEQLIDYLIQTYEEHFSSNKIVIKSELYKLMIIELCFYFLI